MSYGRNKKMKKKIKIDKTAAMVDLPGFDIGDIHIGFRHEPHNKNFAFKFMLAPTIFVVGFVAFHEIYTIEMVNSKRLKEFLREQIKIAGKDPDDFVEKD